jgi:hypothetical protein
LRIDLAFGDRQYKPTAKMNPSRWIARLQGVHGLLLFYNVQASAILFPFLH